MPWDPRVHLNWDPSRTSLSFRVALARGGRLAGAFALCRPVLSLRAKLLHKLPERTKEIMIALATAPRSPRDLGVP